MKLTSRENDHLRSDDGRTNIVRAIPLIDSAHPDGPSENPQVQFWRQKSTPIGYIQLHELKIA